MLPTVPIGPIRVGAAGGLPGGSTAKLVWVLYLPGPSVFTPRTHQLALPMASSTLGVKPQTVGFPLIPLSPAPRRTAGGTKSLSG